MEGDEEVKLFRRLAEIEIEGGLNTRGLILEEHSAAFRWLLASLFAANGGAAVAVLNSNDVLPHGKQISLAFFLAGVLLSLLTAYFSQRAGRAMLPPMNALIGYWIGVSHSGSFDKAKLDQYEADLVGVAGKARVTQVSGWIAAACFLIGSIVVGLYIRDAPQTTTKIFVSYPTPNLTSQKQEQYKPHK